MEGEDFEDDEITLHFDKSQANQVTFSADRVLLSVPRKANQHKNITRDIQQNQW